MYFDKKLTFKEFRLPRIPNLQRAIDKVGEHADRHGTEMVCGVDSSTGEIVTSNIGTEHQVVVPEDAKGTFLVHCHPGINTPLSFGDLMVINGRQTLGNMAVCQDGSLSWTNGLRISGVSGNNVAQQFLLSPIGGFLQYSLIANYGEEIGNTAFSWLLLEAATVEFSLLKNLFIKSATDLRGYEGAHDAGMTMSSTFGAE